MMLEPGVSEMSCGSQRLLGSSGRLMGPSRMDSEKHSRMMLVSSYIRVSWFVVFFLRRAAMFESYLRLLPRVPQARLSGRAPLLRGGFLGVEVDAVRGSVAGEETATLVTEH